MTADSGKAFASDSKRAARDPDLLAVVGELVGELHPKRAGSVKISLSSHLKRDLGIDSLGRTELILRLEREFGVHLPVELLGKAETVGDLLKQLENRGPRARAIAKLREAPELAVIPAATDARTLIDALEWHAAQHPDRLHLTVQQDDASVIDKLTYGELAKAAHAVAAGLIERDVMSGDRIALMLPTGVDFFVTFFGILYAGAVPVPIYPPMRPSQLEDHLRRQAGILGNAEAAILVTMPEGRHVAALLRTLVPSLRLVQSVQDLATGGVDASLPPLKDETTTALIQYTHPEAPATRRG